MKNIESIVFVLMIFQFLNIEIKSFENNGFEVKSFDTFNFEINSFESVNLRDIKLNKRKKIVN